MYRNTCLKSMLQVMFNFRVGYKFGGMECWGNVMNVANQYDACSASRSTSGYSYMPRDVRHLVLGTSYDFGQITRH